MKKNNITIQYQFSILINRMALFLIAAHIVFSSGCFHLIEEHQKARDITLEHIDFSSLPDGEYIGSYNGGMHGWRNNKVKVTIFSGEVTDITLLNSAEYKSDDPDYLELTKRVMRQQTLQVDVISGATLTSKAHLKSIEDALHTAQNKRTE